MKRALLLTFLACAPTPSPTTTGETFGATHAGSYHLGPVDWEGTQWNNSCSPYPRAVQVLEGQYLAGVDNSLNGNGQLCDACALVTTRLGKSVLVRIVTTGSSNAPGDMDLSPEAYAAIHEEDPMGTSANPRPMTWQLAKCTAGSRIHLQYQTQANTDWTSLWVRNARLPLERVRVKSSRHASLIALRRESDGTWNDDSGFGSGALTLELTGAGGATVTGVPELHRWGFGGNHPAIRVSVRTPTRLRRSGAAASLRRGEQWSLRSRGEIPVALLPCRTACVCRRRA